MDPQPIPVICDHCRAAGEAGAEPFAEIADLLDFTPVPVRAHVNNWTADVQRAFVAALAITGSALRAARAIGRYPAGAERLRKQRGGSSFGAACDSALELARERELFRLRDNMAELAEQHAYSSLERDGGSFAYASLPRSGGEGDHPQDGGGAFFSGDDDESSPDQPQSWLDGFLTKYWHKVVAEREARLNGEIVAADFYLRQMTFIELSVDIASGGKGLEQLQRLRLDGHHLIDVAETTMSRLLDHMRRHIWRLAGEPERPEHPPRHLLVEHDGAGGYSTEPLEFTTSDSELSHEEQKARFKQRHEQAAVEQAEWELRAIAEHKARTSSLSRSDGEGNHPQDGGGVQ